MENIEVLIYIIFGVIWIISRILKANKTAQNKNQNKPTGQPTAFPSDERRASDRRPKTIEEILREMTGEAFEEEEEEYEPYNPVNERTSTPEKKTQPTYQAPVSNIPKEYQSFTGEASSTAGYQSIEDMVGGSLLKEDESDRFEEYDIKQRQDSAFGELLKDKDEFKKAIILSEILNRKYT